MFFQAQEYELDYIYISKKTESKDNLPLVETSSIALEVLTANL